MIPDARYGRRAIAWLARFWRARFTLLVVVLAGLGTAHILVRIATAPSSNNINRSFLLQAALNLLAGEGYRDFSDRPMVGWPPLFPLLLAAFGWVGIEPLEAGRWVNATAFGLTILAAGGWLRSNLRSRLLALAATTTLVASLPLSLGLPLNYRKSFFIDETEPLFVLFTLLALMQLGAFLNRRTDVPLWWAAVFTALATLTRYPGVVLIGTGVLVLLPIARRKQTLVFGAISSVPLLAVLVRNWVVTGDLTRATGYRYPTGQSLSDGLSQAIEVFRVWIVPPNAPDGLAYLLGLTVAAVGLAGAAVGLRRRRPDSETAPVYVRLGLVIPFGVFTVIYLVFLIAVVPFTVQQTIDNRYLLPIYVPLLLTAVFLFDRFLSIEAAGWMAAGRYGLAALVGLGTLAHVGFSARENLRTTQAYVAGYGKEPRKLVRWQARWQQSATLQYIRDSHIVGRVYSNKVTFALLGDWTAATLRTYRNIPRNMEWAEIEAGAHIVWLDEFYYLSRKYLGYDYLDVRLLPGLEIVAELADGVVFRRTAAEPFDAKRHRARKQRYVNQLIQQASEQVVRAGWTVYRTGRTLIYRKESCAPADVKEKFEFVLHVVPVVPADLPAHRQQYRSENLDFHFNWGSQRKALGFRLDDQCIAIAQLPDYDIDRIHVGQWIPRDNRTLWDAEMEMHRARKQRYIDQLIQQASEHVRRAGWTVYRTERTLIYRKESCAPADVQAKFVLHVVPADPADLPAHRQQYDSENLDFYFRDSRRKSPSFRLGDQCIAIAHLPAYPIDRIHIGQWIAAEDRTLWEAEFSPGR